MGREEAERGQLLQVLPGGSEPAREAVGIAGRDPPGYDDVVRHVDDVEPHLLAAPGQRGHVLGRRHRPPARHAEAVLHLRPLPYLLLRSHRESLANQPCAAGLPAGHGQGLGRQLHSAASDTAMPGQSRCHHMAVPSARSPQVWESPLLIDTNTQILQLDERKTSLEPDAMRATMVAVETEPSPTRCIYYETRRVAVPACGGEELDGYDSAVGPDDVPGPDAHSVSITRSILRKD